MAQYPAAVTDLAERPSVNATRRVAPPSALLQLSRGEGIAVEVPWLAPIERDPQAFDRPTKPSPFWVESIEPEPRWTTPSMLRYAERQDFRRTWLSMISAVLMVVSGLLVANLFAGVP